MTVQETTHTLVASARRFFSGTMISRVTGLAREVAMAAIFGATPEVAAFWMAFRFAHFLRRLFGEGALHAAFVPHFESLRTQESGLGARFFYDLSMGVALSLLLLSCLIEGILGGVLLFCHPAESQAEVLKLTMLMQPALLFICLYALNSSLLQCERSFFLPSVAPAAVNLLWIASLLLIWKQPRIEALQHLSMLIVLAFALQWVVTVPPVVRYLAKTLGKGWALHRFSGKEMGRILKPFALGIIGVAATQVNSAVDVLFARVADPQGPAYLWYALRIQQLPMALFGVGLAGILLPSLTRAIQQREESRSLQFLNFALQKAFLLMLPMIAGLFCLGFSGINLCYGRGAFSQEATLGTTLCLWAYGLALMPMSLVLILAAAFYGRKNYRIPTLISLLSVACNILLNGLFVFLWRFETTGIALATALSSCINSVALAFFLKKRYSLDLKGVGVTACKALGASSFATAVTLLLGHWLFHDNTLAWLLGQSLAPFSRELFSQLLAFGIQASCYAVAFLVAAYLLRIQEFFNLAFLKGKIIHPS